MRTLYPNLVGEIAKRGVKKSEIAKCIGTSYKSLGNKLSGKTKFSLPEAMQIKDKFFPEFTLDELFAKCMTENNEPPKEKKAG